jgi:hypothetical protein
MQTDEELRSRIYIDGPRELNTSISLSQYYITYPTLWHKYLTNRKFWIPKV